MSFFKCNINWDFMGGTSNFYSMFQVVLQQKVIFILAVKSSRNNL